MSDMKPFDWCLVIISLIAAASLLVGCGTQTRGESNGDLTHDERLTGSGTVGAQPFTFDVTRSVTETTKESQESTTKLQAPELAAGIALALRTSFPGLGAVLPSPGMDIEKLVLAIATATGGAVAVHRQIAASRANACADAERKRADEHKADAVEGWAKATATHQASVTVS